jgi:hypothetical protein
MKLRYDRSEVKRRGYGKKLAFSRPFDQAVRIGGSKR